MKHIILKDGSKRILNWRPQIKDKRDLKYQLDDLISPPKFCLKDKCPPIVDQGQLGSCTGNAWVGLNDFYQLWQITRNIPPEHAPEVYGSQFQPSSRLFVYYNERVYEGTVNYDSGAEIRDGAKSLLKVGACPESMWPYDTGKFANSPPPECYLFAAKHEFKAYWLLSTIDDMKHRISTGFPFVFGFAVYDSFQSIGPDGLMPMPSGQEQVLGGHAVMAVGYDDEKRLVTVRNSWGESWGDNGYFYMPYDFILDPNFASDFTAMSLP